MTSDVDKALLEEIQAQRVDLEQCRQQLAAAQADVDLHWTNLGLAAEANERLTAQLAAAQDVPGLVRNDVELRAEIKRLNAVIREYATNLARLDAAQQEPALVGQCGDDPREWRDGILLQHRAGCAEAAQQEPANDPYCRCRSALCMMDHEYIKPEPATSAEGS